MSNSINKPHNSTKPIDLRQHPICYLCGGTWMLDAEHGDDKHVVECEECGLNTYATYDDAVWDARNWTR